LSFNGKPVIEAADDVKAHFKTHGLDFLLPAGAATAKALPDVDPALLDAARSGNQTARTRIYKIVGDVAATDALIAKKPTDTDASKNPWRSKNFRTDVAAQKEAARIISALGTKAAASMAKSAGRTLDGRELKVA
jgi:hypothetical protein